MPFWITPEGQQNQNNMKIKVTQLDERARLAIANALLEYYPNITEEINPSQLDTHELSARIAHGEILLCEYVYPEQEKGGVYGE